LNNTQGTLQKNQSGRLKRVLSVVLSVCKKLLVWLRTAKRHAFQAKLPSCDYLNAELNGNKLWEEVIAIYFLWIKNPNGNEV
jgi:hypothetical protein